MNPTGQSATLAQESVEVVVHAYNKRPEAIEATYPISHIFVIDDGSAIPAAIPNRIATTGKVSLTRVPTNQKNAAARNVGLAKCVAPLIACVNCEVLPAEDWLATCVSYLSERQLSRTRERPLSRANWDTPRETQTSRTAPGVA